MTLVIPIDSPPDWSQPTATELCCPLCEYNLRGLTEPRCPECGFAFTWAELLQGKREAHRYLFEHHPKRNVWSFFKTYFHDSFPFRFWRDVNPSNVVQPRRLMLYWAVSVLPLLLAVFSPFAWNFYDELTAPPPPYRLSPTPGSYFRTSPRAWVSPVYVPPTPLTFTDHLQHAWDLTIDDLTKSSMIVGSLVVLIWPWLTLLALLVFSQSMQRAKIKKEHVLRVIVYGCDYGLVMFCVVFLGKHQNFSDLWLLQLVFACGTLTLYRVYFAYSSYLRFHLPFATVFTSQILVFLAALIVYFQTHAF